MAPHMGLASLAALPREAERSQPVSDLSLESIFLGITGALEGNYRGPER